MRKNEKNVDKEKLKKQRLCLENVHKNDNTFLKFLPQDNIKAWKRITSDHPTPYIFVDFKDARVCERTMREINNNSEINFTAKVWEDRGKKSGNDVDEPQAASSQNVTETNRMTDNQKGPSLTEDVVEIKGQCILCYKEAAFMCERCLDPYCSATCQKMHWQAHRIVCRRMPNLVPYKDMLSNNTTNPISSNGLTTTISKIPQENISEKSVTTKKQSPQKSKNLMKNTDLKPMSMKNGPQTPATNEPQSPSMNGGTMYARSTAGSVLELTSPMKTTSAESLPEKPSKTLDNIQRIDFPGSGSNVRILTHTKEFFNRMFICAQEHLPFITEIRKTAMESAKNAPNLRGPPQKNHLYLALYFNSDGTDDHWCRVKLMNYNEETRIAKVAYFDYGNMEEISVTKLREFPDELMKLKRVTHRIVLKEVPFESNAVDLQKYKEDLLQKTLKVVYTDQPKNIDTPVTLYEVENDTCVNTYLNRYNIAAEKATFKALKPLKFTMDSIGYKNQRNFENINCVVVLDEFLSLGKLHIMPCQDAIDLAILMQNAGEYCDNLPEPYHPNEDELCFAKYAYDEEDGETWFRVSIVKILEKDMYYVLFIDYGNFDEVSAKNIRKMTQDFICECSIIVIREIEGINASKANPLSPEKVTKLKSIMNGAQGFFTAEKITYDESKRGTILSIPDIVAQI